MKLLPLIAAIYAVVFSAVFALTTPPLESPDEPAHLNYVNVVVQHRALPNQYDPLLASPGEGHQHPLYYVLAAAAAGAMNGGQPVPFAERTMPWPTDPGFARPQPIKSSSGEAAFYSLRLLGAVFAGLLVLQVYRLCKLLDIDPLWPTLLVATLPQFLFISSAISNDGLTALLCAVAIASTVAASLEGSARNWVKAGLWTGLAFLTKKSAVVLFPAGLLLLLLTRKTQNGHGKNTLRYAGCALLLASPILMRNQLLYSDPLGTEMELTTLSGLVTSRSIASPYFVTDFPVMLASSFVGVFGWTVVQIPMRLVALYWLAVVPGFFRSIKATAMRPQALYLWAVVLLNLAGLIHYNLNFTQAQGRLLFPSLAAFAALWGIGMTALTQKVQPKTYKILAGGAIAALVALDIYSVTLNYTYFR